MTEVFPGQKVEPNQRHTPLLCAEDILFRYPGAPEPALTMEGYRFCADRGSGITTIIGPNGSGKSTFLRLLAGLLVPQGPGSVLFEGMAISSIPSPKRKRSLSTKIAYLPQQPPVPPLLKVGQLVLLGREPHRRRGWFDRAEDLRKARAVMDLTGVTPLAHRPIQTLSGGEQQRAWLAKALAQEPCLLLLDEPVSNLDVGNQVEALELVRAVARDREVGVVMVLHDLNLAAQYSDRVVLLKDGRPVADGPPEQVLEKRILEELYQVTLFQGRNEITDTALFIPAARRRNVGGGQR